MYAKTPEQIYKRKEVGTWAPAESQTELWRRACGCVRTSDKLKKILSKFPEPPPPTPIHHLAPIPMQKGSNVICANMKEVIQNHNACTHYPGLNIPVYYASDLTKLKDADAVPRTPAQRKCWQLLLDVVALIQLAVVATALAIYYLIYCYMQVIYYTLRSAVYFHQADGPMKVTIAVVTITSVIIGLQFIARVDRFLKMV